MKATGIVRRVDDLGRIIIPKEIRRTLNIKEGDPLEIYIDHEAKNLIFHKYVDETIETSIDALLDRKIPEDAKTLLRIAQKIIKESENNE